MLKTNQPYINEFNFFDNVMECVEECKKEVDMAVYSYNNNKRQIELKSFFEGAMDDELFIEKEGEGVLAKIGNAIVKLVKKVADFLTDTKEKLFGMTQKAKTDAEIVNKLIDEHPELKKEVIEGLEKEWFTYRDVAKFEKDVVGLIQMLDKKKIDHETFKDKMKKACKEFTESGKVILAASCTLGSLLMIAPNVSKGVKASRSVLQDIGKTAGDFTKNVEKNYTENDVNMLQAIGNAFGQAIGIITKECNQRQRGQGMVASILNRFVKDENKRKAKLDAYEDYRKAKHDAARNKAEEKRVREMQREIDRVDKKDRDADERHAYQHSKYNDEYYQRLENKLKREKEHTVNTQAVKDNIRRSI